MVLDAEGRLRDAVNVSDELAVRQAEGWVLVEIDSDETVLHDQDERTVLTTSYLLAKAFEP